MPTAIKIEGRAPNARFSFICDVYEPMQVEHNGMPAWVARGVAPRYLFHTGKGRWVVSKVMDDGYKCWAYMKSSETPSPADSKEKWVVCEKDGQWREDANMRCSAVPASNDKFVQLRLSLDADMKKYGMIEKDDLKKLWRRLDYNGNNIVSLAEIDKMVVELTQNGVWPAWLNSKPALMRAYKKTCLKDGDGDDWVEKKEFHALLLNIFWFAKLWQVFNAVDTGGDRRIDVAEFSAGLAALGLSMTPQEAQQEFRKLDTNGGGQVLFVELCAYVRQRVNPDDNPEFDADILGGEHCATASYNTAGHHHHSGGHHQHAAAHTRGIDFASLAASGGSAPTDASGGISGGSIVSRHETLRACGEGATLDLHVRPKAMSDFDDLEEQIKALCKDTVGLRKMWSHLDFNGNGIVSLAEIDKFVVENYPLLNHKPALMRCYKQTMERKDEFIHRREFKKFIVNLFYFNKLYWVFDQCNGDDRRITVDEFKMVLSLCGVQVANPEAEFRKIDKNGGGFVLFDEFCHYFCSKACPEGLTDFVDDGIDRTKNDGTAQVLASASHQVTIITTTAGTELGVRRIASTLSIGVG
eukprot:CAMPEP_0176113968 /NCGR_PEP_ID=MMETSP0120_2-20121206/57231_1 /TAXON_ID=160619 /ORGANISM="Kryptoperidinium foliaceum, Strain CCMP 1326" /LENGTH=581 /DNA_ID=CAMNT_0017448195 /DNA_START=61 /DNA_END=1803 /DNA_ORIENTATION=+